MSKSDFAWVGSILALTAWLTCYCVCSFVMSATSASQSGSIKSQLVDVFKSPWNILPLIDETGELGAFGNLVANEATLGELTSGCAEPVWLPGWANGLMDAKGIFIRVAGAVLAPAHEPGLANGE